MVWVFSFSNSLHQEIQVSLGSWIVRYEVWILHTGFRIPCQRNLDSESIELNSGFQGQEFWISQLKISQILEFALPFIERFVAFYILLGRSGEGEKYLMMDVNNKILQELHKNIFELTNTCFVVFSQPVSFQTKAIITSFGVVAQL